MVRTISYSVWKQVANANATWSRFHLNMAEKSTCVWIGHGFSIYMAEVTDEDWDDWNANYASGSTQVAREDDPIAMLLAVNGMAVNQDGHPVMSFTFEDHEGLNIVFEGESYVATAGQTSFFDEVVTSELRVQTGWYEIIANAAKGDFIEFSVIDKDDTLGLFSTYGLTPGVDILELSKYVRNEPINPGAQGVRQMFPTNGARPVVPGLYLRTGYTSVGLVDVEFKRTIKYFEE